jgi:hypothetical protein
MKVNQFNLPHHTDKSDSQLPDLPCTVVAENEKRSERGHRIIQAVWQRIPAPDRLKMLQAISEWSDTQVILLLHNDWKHSLRTNAIISLSSESAVIEMEAGYFSAADDHHVMATLAHELGHLRGSLDDDLSEERAHQYQHEWGFPNGQVVFKDEACRYMDSVLKEEGIPGELFWGLDGENYYYLRGEARLTLKSAEVHLMFDQPWATLKGLLLGYWPEDWPEISKRMELADELECTERFAEYERRLTNITESSLPEHMW